jgi:hypothetical protein
MSRASVRKINLTMAGKSKEPKEPKRLNRTVGVGEAIVGALDPVFKKRGFAGRDIITHWQAMAPAPYDKVAMPDKLSWPRGERGAEGATLYLRTMAGHAMAVSHDGPRIAAAVNRYFGYVLVGQVRISAEPFSPGSVHRDDARFQPTGSEKTKVNQTIQAVADDGVREALRQLGLGIISKAKRDGQKE